MTELAQIPAPTPVPVLSPSSSTGYNGRISSSQYPAGFDQDGIIDLQLAPNSNHHGRHKRRSCFQWFMMMIASFSLIFRSRPKPQDHATYTAPTPSSSALYFLGLSVIVNRSQRESRALRRGRINVSLKGSLNDLIADSWCKYGEIGSKSALLKLHFVRFSPTLTNHVTLYGCGQLSKCFCASMLGLSSTMPFSQFIDKESLAS